MCHTVQAERDQTEAAQGATQAQIDLIKATSDADGTLGACCLTTQCSSCARTWRPAPPRRPLALPP